MHNLQGAKVTVVGLGIEGIDLVRFLTAEGASVTVSDARPPEQLTDALAAIAPTGARLSLGGNRTEDTEHADAVFVSQGVPSDLPALRAAEANGVPLSSMLGLFLERCPAPVTGITGSAGKTTTTALVGAMLDAAQIPHVVGGNIGVGLLSLLPEITSDTKVVAEMSHTQLERIARSPEVACVTNVTPNHLDRFTWDAYVDLKRRVFQFQQPEDAAVFNLDDEVSRAFMAEAPGRALATSRRSRIPADGAMLEGDRGSERIVRVLDGETAEVMRRDEIPLRGEHNVENVLSAVAVTSLLGVSPEASAAAVRAFTGVPHRLEPVATVNGVVYINDSIATAPERTLAGMRAFGAERLVLLLGGRDKNLPVRALGEEIVRRCQAVITFGEASDLYATAVRDAPGSEAVTLRQVADVPAAVEAAAQLARPGDIVLFSPAGTSFDAYRNFEARGRHFREAVAALGGSR